MKNWFQKAREASGLSLEECASVLLDSRNSFARKEENPGTFTLTSFVRCIASSTKTPAKSFTKHSVTSIFNMLLYTRLTGITFKEAHL